MVQIATDSEMPTPIVIKSVDFRVEAIHDAVCQQCKEEEDNVFQVIVAIGYTHPIKGTPVYDLWSFQMCIWCMAEIMWGKREPPPDVDPSVAYQ
jgi:hypothetical protein